MHRESGTLRLPDNKRGVMDKLHPSPHLLLSCFLHNLHKPYIPAKLTTTDIIRFEVLALTATTAKASSHQSSFGNFAGVGCGLL